MNQISITIAADNLSELTEKVCDLAAQLLAPRMAQPIQPVQQPIAQFVQPVIPSVQPVMPPVAPVQPVMPPAQAAPVAPAPTATPTYTLDQLALACAPLMDAGRAAELQQLLANFEVRSITELPKEKYGAFATFLRSLGAKI